MSKGEQASVPQVFISNDKIQQERKKMAMTKVFERLYLGDADEADRLATANPFGITAVVCVNTEVNRHWRNGITYVPPLDEYEMIPPRRFEQILTAISKLIRTGNVLLHCGGGISRSPVVVALCDTLAGDLVKIEAGTNCDEVKWTDVAVHSCQILNASKKVIFVSASELISHKGAIDDAQSDGLKIVPVPENIKNSLRGISDLQGNPVRDLTVYQTEWEKSFEFKFVKPDKLSKAEAAVFERWKAIADLVGGLPNSVREIKTSETMRPDFLTGNTTEGLWDPALRSIIVLRSQLNSLPRFAGTILHEIAHAKSGYDDVTRDFETALTHMLGQVAASTFVHR